MMSPSGASVSRMAKSGIPLSEWSGSGASDRLRETVDEFNEQSVRQTAEMIRLTRAILALTAVLGTGRADRRLALAARLSEAPDTSS